MSNIFFNKVKNSIDNKKCHIIPAIQNIILNYGKNNNDFNLSEGILLAGEASSLNPDGLLKSQSRVWVPLIWNALKFLNYDVPIEWLDINLDAKNRYKLLDISKRLSKLKNWGKYTMIVLKNAHKNNFNKSDNDFESMKVKKLSKFYRKKIK